MKRQIFNFLLLLGFYTMTAQSGTITGSVTDSNNNDALPGVNVIVKTTTNGTNTDFNGNFSLDNVKTGDVLVVFLTVFTNNGQLHRTARTVCFVQLYRAQNIHGAITYRNQPGAIPSRKFLLEYDHHY